MKLVLAALLATSVAHADAPDDVRAKLAASFAKKDTTAIARLVSDPYSGLRFCKTWDDATWKRTARTLENAKSVESTPIRKTYAAEGRRFTIDEADGGWKLDLNSLLGPFPHE